MWGGVPMAAAGGMSGIYGGGAAGSLTASSSALQGGAAAANQKHDIFVGNLSFNTTEEQLLIAFSEVGRVVNVRMVTDQDTGKPRGFAFVEFEQAQAALSAIRNMNDYELNGRRLRVNFSNSSHLEALAGKLGMDLSQQTGKQGGTGGAHHNNNKGTSASAGGGASTGTNAVSDALKGLSKGEMYDVVAKLKEIADRDPDEARRVLSGHPQLPEALLYIMSKLDMVKTALPAEAFSIPGGGFMAPVPVAAAAAAAAPQPARAADPRAAAALPRVDPRQAAIPTRSDPRQRADPRAVAAARAPPPPPPPPRMVPQQQQQQLQQQQQHQQQLQQQVQQQQQPMAQPGYPNMQQQPGVSDLDPALVQQVLSLTPQQIQQLPPDKQQIILQLRQQITGSL